MRKLYLLLLCAGIIAISSCTDNEVTGQTSSSKFLQISTEITTRSIIESSSFNTGDEIGVFVSNDSGKEYAEGSFNVKATFNEQWKMNMPVSLTESPATVYAYYPYCSNDKTEEYYPYISGNYFYIDLRQNGKKGQTDYLFGQAEGMTNISSPKANIHFRHVLSRLTFTIKRTPSDQGQGLLSSVALRSPSNNLFYIGYIDLQYGTVSDLESNRTKGKIKINTNLTLNSETEQKVDMLVIPRTLNTIGELTLELIVDRKPYIVDMPAATWEAGQQYTYPITINRAGTSEPEKTKAQIGDYYYDDGTWSSQYNADKNCVGIVFALSEEQGGDINVNLDQSMHGRVVALNDLTNKAEYYAWGPATDVAEIPNFYALDGKYSDGYLPIDGKENYSGEPHISQCNLYVWPAEKGNEYALTDYTVLGNSTVGDEFPAMAACSHYTTGEIGFGWYLPSIGELARLAMVCNANLLDAKGFESIKYPGYTYWSSSESKNGLEAWCYVAEFGRIYANEKNMELRVRPVYSF